MQAIPIVPFDPSARQILPPTAAVQAPRFRQRDWQLSAQAREILDLIVLDVPQTPRPEPTVDMSESIVMEGCEIRRTIRTGGHIVRQQSVAVLPNDAPLSLAEPVPFERVPTLASEAAAALDRMSTRKPTAPRRRAVPAPSAGFPWTVTVMVVAALGVAALAAWRLI